MEVVIRGTPEEIAALALAVQERQWPEKSIQFDVDVSRLAKVLLKSTDDRAPEAPERPSS